MNKQTLTQLQQAIENMLSALERLETALDAGDQRKTGSALHELHYELRALLVITQGVKDHE